MIKKKIITALTVAAVFVASVMPVAAAGSPSTGGGSSSTTTETPAASSESSENSGSSSSNNGGNTVTPVAGQLAAGEVIGGDQNTATLSGSMTNTQGVKIGKSADAIKSATTSAIQALILRDLKAFGAAFGNTAVVNAATTAGAKVSAIILALGDLEAGTLAKDADGFYTVTLNVASVQAGDCIVVVHRAASGWELIKPTVVGAGFVTFRTASFSPFAVVKVAVSGGAVAAPQTGSSMAPVYALVLVCAAGAVLCSKKYFAK